MGVFWKRLNAKGCFWAMAVGFAVGIFRMAVDTPITLGLFKSYPDGFSDQPDTFATDSLRRMLCAMVRCLSGAFRSFIFSNRSDWAAFASDSI